MFCSNCGTKIEEGANFCGNCGKKISIAQDKQPVAYSDYSYKAPTGWELQQSAAVVILSIFGGILGIIAIIASVAYLAGLKLTYISSYSFYISIGSFFLSIIALVTAFFQYAKKVFPIAAISVSLFGMLINGWQFFTSVPIGNDTRQTAITSAQTTISPIQNAISSVNPNGIRQIDFMNFTYHLGKSYCSKVLGKAEVKVLNGSFGEMSDKADGFEVDSNRTVYGDITGDGSDEAVVITYCGSMHPIEQAFVYTMKNGAPVLLARLKEGNRAFGGIVRGHICKNCDNGISIQNGLLSVERSHGDAACCPKYIEKTTYRWDGKKFVQVGSKKVRRFIEKN